MILPMVRCIIGLIYQELLEEWKNETDPIGGIPTVSDDVESNINRITALENGRVSPNESQAVHDFHSGLTEIHTAGDIVRVSPYDKVTRLYS